MGVDEVGSGNADVGNADTGNMGVERELPVVEVEVTRTLIVAGAIASRDYQDVHHDAEAAREKGAPDVFMNILTTNGLVGRYVTDHFGPRARLRSVRIRLGVPNFPGDVMVLRGTVLAGAVGAGVVEVRVVGSNARGNHVAGTVTVELPDSASQVGPGHVPDSAS
jgi:acyl dehydratase